MPGAAAAIGGGIAAAAEAEQDTVWYKESPWLPHPIGQSRGSTILRGLILMRLALLNFLKNQTQVRSCYIRTRTRTLSEGKGFENEQTEK